MYPFFCTCLGSSQITNVYCLQIFPKAIKYPSMMFQLLSMVGPPLLNVNMCCCLLCIWAVPEGSAHPEQHQAGIAHDATASLLLAGCWSSGMPSSHTKAFAVQHSVDACADPIFIKKLLPAGCRYCKSNANASATYHEVVCCIIWMVSSLSD